MKVAHVKVTGTQIEVTEVQQITSGMVGATVEIEFSPEWKDLTKTVVFKAGAVSQPILNPGKVIEIPPEVLAKKNKQLFIGVSGFSDTGETVMPTVYGFINNIAEGTDSRSLMPEVSLTPLEQLQAQIDATEEMVNRFLNDAAEGKYNGATGPQGPQGPIGKVGPVGPRGVTFYVHQEKVEHGYRIYWTNDGNLPNPEPAIVTDYYHSEEFAALAKQVANDAAEAQKNAAQAKSASTSATQHAGIASNASTLATNAAAKAATSEANAKKYADSIIGDTESAEASAQRAEKAAANASGSESRVKADANRAYQSATSAARYSGIALQSSESAEESQKKAKASELAAEKYSTNASKSEKNAKASENKAESAKNEAVLQSGNAQKSAEIAEAAAKSINQKAANALTGSVRGKNAYADNVSPLPHTVTGRVYGNNLLPFPYESTTGTINGVTFTVNADGTIKASGTASDKVYFILAIAKNLPKDFFNAPVYLSGNPISGNENVQVRLWGMGKGYTWKDTGSGIKIPANQEIVQDEAEFDIFIESGQTVNAVFKPMVAYDDRAFESPKRLSGVKVTLGPKAATATADKYGTFTADSQSPEMTCKADDPALYCSLIYNRDTNDLSDEIKELDSRTITEHNSVTVTLGKELVSGNVVMNAGWSGNLQDGFTHHEGKQGALEIRAKTTPGCIYLFEFTTTPESYEFGTAAFGSMYQNYLYNGTTHISIPLMSDGGPLKFVPFAKYKGTMTGLTLKQILPGGDGEKKEIELLSYMVDGHEQNLGYWNVILGKNSMENAVPSTRTIAIGNHTLSKLEGGHRNIAIGTFAMNKAKGADKNIAIGADAMIDATMAEDSVSVGMGAMGKGRYLQRNVAVGSYALTGDAESRSMDNVATGYSAGYKTTGNGNTMIGSYAGSDIETGTENVAIGHNARGANGSKNVALGAGATFSENVENSVAIGAGVTADKSNQVKIGDENTKEVIIGGKDFAKIDPNQTCANALVRTVQGEVIAVDDVSPLEHVVGCKVSSNNKLFPNEMHGTVTVKGITFTPTGDGGIKIEGDNDGSGLSDFTVSVKKLFPYESGTLSFGGGDEKVDFVFGSEDFSTARGSTKSSGTINRVGNGNKIGFIYIRVQSGAKGVNATVYPMLVSGKKPAPYTPYIPDLSKVTVSRAGRNFFGGLRLANSIKEKAKGVIDEDAGTVYYEAKNIAETALLESQFKPLTSYTFVISGYSKESSSNASNLKVKYTDGTIHYLEFSGVPGEKDIIVYTSDPRKTISYFGGVWQGYKTTLFYNECGIFEGSFSVDDFVPYVGQDYIPNVDGIVSGMTSLSPHMTVLTDTPGALLDLSYNQDLMIVNQRQSDRITALENLITEKLGGK